MVFSTFHSNSFFFLLLLKKPPIMKILAHNHIILTINFITMACLIIPLHSSITIIEQLHFFIKRNAEQDDRLFLFSQSEAIIFNTVLCPAYYPTFRRMARANSCLLEYSPQISLCCSFF